jgi:hypothetical protein
MVRPLALGPAQHFLARRGPEVNLLGGHDNSL